MFRPAATASGEDGGLEWGLSTHTSWRSLFLYDTSDAQAFKLLSDLLEYYEENYRPEFDDAEALPYSSGRYDRSNKGTYLRCREIIDREKAHSTPFAETAEYLKGKFSSEYLDKQIDLLSRMRTENPTEAIGKSKELIESCCKTILEEQGVTVEKGWDVSRLISETEKLLHVSAKQVDENAPAAKHVKKLLGSLHGVAVGVAEFRNEFGSGHGKSASFRAAPFVTRNLRSDAASRSASTFGKPTNGGLRPALSAVDKSGSSGGCVGEIRLNGQVAIQELKL